MNRADPATIATQVFLSYAREDVDVAQALAEALHTDGHRVWWDRRLGGGDDFSIEIERQLNAARVAIVLWSATSVQSGFVRDESSRARDAGKLLPVRIEDVALPLGFGTLHTLDLIAWDGEADDDACLALREEVRRQVSSTPPAPAGAGLATPLPRRSLLSRQQWRRPAAAAVAAVALAASAWWYFADDGNAQAHFERGLAAHFDTEPNLEVARNAYLAALREKADFAPAHFYLAHVYALLQLPGDARTHFKAALAQADQLDPAQRSDAQKQLQAVSALLAAVEPAPVVRKAGEPADDPPAAAAPAPAPATAPSPAAAAVPAPPTLVRTAPSEAQQQIAQTQASALLGRDRQAQVAAATTLALNTTLAADALPKVLQSTLETLRTQPNSAAAREAVAQSLRLLQGASPSLLREHGRGAQRIADAGRNFGGSSAAAAADVQKRLLDARAQKPLAFVQIADERQRALARGVVARLASMGYGAPGIENVGARAPARTEVRTQGASDPALARWMAQHLGKVTQAEVAVRTLRQVQPKTDTYEIWFDKDLCLTPARTVPACSGG